VTACFVAIAASDANGANGTVAGYYTLASASVMLTDLPADLARKLPRYPSVPAVRMGRLAVAQAFKGQGLGAALLANALGRAVHAEIAAYALLVDAKDTSAAAFYAHHGFVALPDRALTLFLPLATVNGL
jgi:GNAT superfamily N-acetyltransferase